MVKRRQERVEGSHGIGRAEWSHGMVGGSHGRVKGSQGWLVGARET